MSTRLLALGALVTFAPALMQAHGVGQRIDLPIPLDLYVLGGMAVVALSFLAVWFLPERALARLAEYPQREVRSLRFLLAPWSLRIVQALSVVSFILMLSAGFFGVDDSAENILPITIWVIFAVGMTFVSAFVGNVWSVVNPLRIIHRVVTPLLTRVVRTQYIWREAWGLWPALIAFLVFRWIENILPISAEPYALAWMVLAFSIYSLIGMTLFGREVWLKHADPFAVFFSYLSRFAPFTIAESDGQPGVYLRPPACALLRTGVTTSGTLFVLAMLAGVTADGFFDTPLMASIVSAIAVSPIVIQTVALLGLFGIFVGVYYALSWLIAILLGGASTAGDYARLFVFSLVPIAVAYEFAHYLSLLTLEGQRFIALLSDPFGFGWNLFGTAALEISYTLINLKVLWNIQVIAIVVGHVISVGIAHAIAERFFERRDDVLASQYPLLLVMLLYTMFSLWIIAQPIVI